ncbi:MAG TPA: aldehyde ferredoxin oxidoreductase family protein [Caldilineae bacterium]|nr:aldehyde ferredoxin oxidoreductase family protein [Caldilineae bacterium]
MTVYAGKYLRVDLAAGAWAEEPISEKDVKTWLLGSGFAAKLFFDQMDPTLDPLHPDAPLLVFNGVLTGAFAPTGARSSWCGRSPLTGIWNESNLGGHWGAGLRFAGYDGLVITGRAQNPVYLWIDGQEGVVTLRDASHLWGKDYFETAEALLQETDVRAQVAGIGPAGENLVRIAGIMSGPAKYVRTAGRGGMGALLGSKNLKAVVVRGKQRPVYPDRKRFLAEVKAQNAEIRDNSVAMSAFGTAGGVVGAEWHGDFPIQNWRLGQWDEVETVSGQVIYEQYLVRHTFCHACPIGCGKEVEVLGGKYATPRGEGVEYETISGFGGMLGNANVESIILANSLCNRYGLDTISTSAAIAFATEAFEKGLIDEADCGGLTLAWGDPDVMLALIEKIARREDIGAVLAEGVREAAHRIGQGAEDFAIHVKGLEVAYHDPRAFVSMAVNYATANRGGCHLESLSYWNGYGITHPDLGYPEQLDQHKSGREQAKLAYDYQNLNSVFNPLGLCKFIIKGKVGPVNASNLVNSALGWDWTPADLLAMGDKLFQLKRLINLRLGVTAAADTLPKRLLTESRPTGFAAGVLPDLDLMLPIYYQLRGWNTEGRPQPERLRLLGLIDDA